MKPMKNTQKTLQESYHNSNDPEGDELHERNTLDPHGDELSEKFDDKNSIGPEGDEIREKNPTLPTPGKT